MGVDWVKKYRPNSSKEICGQDKAVKELKNHIEAYKGGKPLLLYGAPGTGKTSSVYAVAKELGFEIVEINASDSRNKDSINQILGGALKQQSLFSKGKIVLVDEIDGISGQKDRGGLPALIKLTEKSALVVLKTFNKA